MPGTPAANLLTGLGIDEVLTRRMRSGRGTSSDALGSTLALSDPAGALPTQYTYEPFGSTTITGTASSNPFQYTGRENDGTGLYYYRARYYSPTLSRFVSEDPLECERRNGKDLYAYVSNNPVNLVDPSGLAESGPGSGGGRDVCDAYDKRCRDKLPYSPGRGGGGGGGGIATSYLCGAGDCCREFPEGPAENCTRKCLIDEYPSCENLDGTSHWQCTIRIHVRCYQRCGYKPWPWQVPLRCYKTGLGF